MRELLSQTESVCPVCLERIPAERVRRGEDIYLEKTCTKHGPYSTVVWRGMPEYNAWYRPKVHAKPKNPFTDVEKGCPYDCGQCPDHRQHPCCVLLEVTQRCDLGCPICFADSAVDKSADPSLQQIQQWYERLLEASGPYNIQLSGGEPCVRDDLNEVIKLGCALGFKYFQLNTNGLRIARDLDYLASLVDAGLSSVFLQFDGTRPEIHQKIRGRSILETKLRAIENCRKAGVGVILVPTLIPGINDDNIGEIIRFGIDNSPTIRGVHFQPVSYFGRYPYAPTDAQRITLPEVMQKVCEQTDHLIDIDTFCPPAAENAHCSFLGSFVIMPEGTLVPLTNVSRQAECCTPASADSAILKARSFMARNWTAPGLVITLGTPQQSLGGWDDFLERKRTHSFAISGMAFQDAWTLDLDRLRECKVHVASENMRIIPFCAFNLTDVNGYSIYRK